MSRHERARRASDIGSGIFSRIFSSYGKLDAVWRGGAVYGAFSRFRDVRWVKRMRRGVARSVERSMILRAMRTVFSALPWLTVRSYGMFFFSFGFYTSVIFAIKTVATSLTADIDALLTGAAFILLSVPLLFSTKTLAGAVISSRFASYLVIDILGYRREKAASETVPRRRLDIMFIAGMILGLLTFFVEPHQVVGAILLILLAGAVFCNPETGVILLFALFPLLRDMYLSLLVTLIFLSYLIKLICGRRTMRFDIADTFMMVFFMMTALAEIINYGAGTHGAVRTVRLLYMSVYFLAVNMISNSAWRSRLMRAMMLGASIMAVISIGSIFEDVLTEFTVGVGSKDIISLTGWLSDVSGAAEISSYYLAMMLPVMIAYLLRRGIGKKRLNILFFSLVTVAAAALTMSRGLWFGAIAGVIVMLLIFDMRLAFIPAAAAVCVTAAAALLPESMRAGIEGIFDMSGALTRNRIAVRALSGSIFFDNIFGGIGGGEGVFYDMYNAYSTVGASADNSQSLFLQIGVELGIFGLLVFLLAVIFLLIKSFTGSVRGADRSNRLCSGALAAGLTAALMIGVSNYIWVDDRMLLLFFMFAGAVSSYSAGLSAPDEDSADIGTVTGDEKTASVDIGY